MNHLIEIWTDLKTSKTFWLSVAALGVSAEKWASSEITGNQAAVMAFLALVSITQRHAVEKAAALSKPEDKAVTQ